MFERVYFDSSVLIASGWPRLASNLERLALVASTLETKLLLPEPVEMELEEHWMEEYRSSRDRVSAELKKLNRIGERAGVTPGSIPIADDKDVLASYRAETQRNISACNMIRIPCTRRTVDQFFRMAAGKITPLKENDKGFRDAVILYSIVDHLLSEGGPDSVLCAADGVFKEEGLTRRIRQEGVTLEVVDSLDAVVEEFRKRIDSTVERLWAVLEKSATERVNEQFRELEEFVNANLEVPQEALLSFSLPGVHLQAMKIARVEKVRTPPPQDHPSSGLARVSITVSLKAYYTALELPYQPPPPLKVGESSQSLPTSPVTMGDLFPHMVEREKDLTAIVEAEGRVEDYQYKNIQYVSVKLVTGFQSLAQTLLTGWKNPLAAK